MKTALGLQGAHSFGVLVSDRLPVVSDQGRGQFQPDSYRPGRETDNRVRPKLTMS